MGQKQNTIKRISAHVLTQFEIEKKKQKKTKNILIRKVESITDLIVLSSLIKQIAKHAVVHNGFIDRCFIK